MEHNFFTHPLWQKFQGHAVTVCRLSDGEHRLRDAYANMLLKEFLPPDTRFVTCVVGGSGQPSLAATGPGGIVTLGRPALFPNAVTALLDGAKPPLLYEFGSDDPSSGSAYRSIARTGLPHLGKRRHRDSMFSGTSFSEQRGRHAKVLSDNAIVYSGWHRQRPVMMLGGSSTVGTWGAVHYVTQSADRSESAIWQQDIQGVIQAQIATTGDEAFDEVGSRTLEVLAPARFWMEGGDRPPSSGWTRETLALDRFGGPERLDLRILVNGTPISAKRATLVHALVLLAWLAHRVDEYHDGFVAQVTTSQVLEALFRYLQIGPQNPLHLGEYEVRDGRKVPVLVTTRPQFNASKIGRHLGETLKELTAAIRAAGGLAYGDKVGVRGDEPRRTFCVVSRPLPHFMPVIPPARGA